MKRRIPRWRKWIGSLIKWVIVCDSKGSEVKQSNYLKIAKCGTQKKRLDKGARELKKLECAMNEGDTRGMVDRVKRNGGMGSSLVKK